MNVALPLCSGVRVSGDLAQIRLITGSACSGDELLNLLVLLIHAERSEAFSTLVSKVAAVSRINMQEVLALNSSMSSDTVANVQKT